MFPVEGLRCRCGEIVLVFGGRFLRVRRSMKGWSVSHSLPLTSNRLNWRSIFPSSDHRTPSLVSLPLSSFRRAESDAPLRMTRTWRYSIAVTHLMSIDLQNPLYLGPVSQIETEREARQLDCSGRSRKALNPSVRMSAPPQKLHGLDWYPSSCQILLQLQPRVGERCLSSLKCFHRATI